MANNTVYTHRYPATQFDSSLDKNAEVLDTELAVHPGRRLLFTRQSGQPLVVGGLPILRDNFGGLKGFVRNLYETTSAATFADTSAGITLAGSNLTANYALIAFMWNGVYQTMSNVNLQVTLTAPQLTSSVWQFYIQRNYGFSFAWSTTLPESPQTLNLAQVTISNSAISAISVFTQTSFCNGLRVHETSVPTALVPTSDANGNMSS